MLLHMYANYLGKNIHFCFHTPFNVNCQLSHY